MLGEEHVTRVKIAPLSRSWIPDHPGCKLLASMLGLKECQMRQLPYEEDERNQYQLRSESLWVPHGYAVFAWDGEHLVWLRKSLLNMLRVRPYLYCLYICVAVWPLCMARDTSDTNNDRSRRDKTNRCTLIRAPPVYKMSDLVSLGFWRLIIILY